MNSQNGDYNKQELDEQDKAFLDLTNAESSQEKDRDSKVVKVKIDDKNYSGLDQKYQNIDCEQEISTILKNNHEKSLKAKKIRFYFLFVTILFGSFSFVLYVSLPDRLKWISFILLGIFIVGIIWYFSFSSGKKSKILKRFERDLRQMMIIEDSYVFAQDKLLHPRINPEADFNLNDLIKAHYFQTINKMTCRNMVKATFRGREFRCCDLFVQVPFDYKEKNNTQLSNRFIKRAIKFGLYGKYVIYPLALAQKASIILYTDNKNIERPSYLKGYTKIDIHNLSESYEIYTTNKKVCREFFNQESFVESLKALKVDKILESYFLSINRYGLFLGLNYSQNLMEFNVINDLSNRPFKHFKNDLQLILEMLESIS